MTNDEAAIAAQHAREDFPDNKLPSRKLKRTLVNNVFGLAPGTDSRMSTYGEVYEEAQKTYAIDAHRVQNVAVSGNTSSHSSPSTTTGAVTMSIQEQIDLINELIKYLESLEDDLKSMSSKYKNYVHGIPLLKEVATKYVDEQLDPSCAMMKRLSDRIDESSIPALEKRIAQLENML